MTMLQAKNATEPNVANKNTRARIMALFQATIPHTIFWLLCESYSSKLYVFMITSISVIASVDSLDYVVANKSKIVRAIVGGVFPGLFLLVLPNYSLLGVCFNVVSFWSGVTA